MAEEASPRALETGALASAARKTSGESGSGSGGSEATRDLAAERADWSLESSSDDEPVVAALLVSFAGVVVVVVAAADLGGGADFDCLVGVWREGEEEGEEEGREGLVEF